MASAMPRGVALARICAVALACVIGTGFPVPGAHAAPSIERQRADFLKAYAVAQMGDGSWRAWSEALQGYPLYPWLQAAQIKHNLGDASPEIVAAYLKRYHDLIPAEDLRRRYLHLLARRHDWKRFLRFYRPVFGDTLACDALRARIARGDTLDFKRDLAVLWREPNLPRACNKVQVWAHEHGLLTPSRLWERIASAADARNANTIAWLARWLPPDQARVARRYAHALHDPERVLHEAGHWPDTGRNREAVLLAITQLAREASERAVKAWPRLDRHFDFSDHARNRILASLALYRAYDFGDDALDLLAALPDAAETDATRAWRVRVAIAQRNWHAALAALGALSADQATSDSWRYLRARVLQKLGKKQAAHSAFAALAGQSNYWGFLAADRLGRAYVICLHRPDYDPAREEALLARPTVARAFELFAVGLLRDARRAWARAFAGADAETHNLAADLAFRRGWYSRAIFTYSYGDLLHHYRERFPLAERESVAAAARATGIEPAWIYASIRAESAWIPDAGSRAGAHGLMQLMAGTARRVARRHHISARGFLYDPDLNIELGSYHLAHLSDRYEGRLWLASAAYNAGIGRVDSWLEERGGLAPDLFIATIPFTETRNYVISVLAYSVIYGWRLSGKPTPLSWRLWGTDKSRDARRRVAAVCPVTETAAAGTPPDAMRRAAD